MTILENNIEKLKSEQLGVVFYAEAMEYTFVGRSEKVLEDVLSEIRFSVNLKPQECRYHEIAEKWRAQLTDMTQRLEVIELCMTKMQTAA